MFVLEILEKEKNKWEKILKLTSIKRLLMPYKEINGVNYYYEETGKNDEIVVFLHGVLWSGRMFDNQVLALKDKFTVVTLDFRGQGKTEVTESGYDFETLYEDTLEFLKSYKKPVHLAGLSMGGMISMRIAARNPELVKSLILLETSPDPEVDENIPKYKQMNFVAKYFGFRFVTKPVMKIMFSKSWLEDPYKREERKYWKKHLLSNNKIGITRAVTGVIERESIEDELKNIICPTLIITGEEDVAIRPEKSEKMHDAIKGSRLIHIPKAGHSSTIENPEPINNEIKDFLAHLN